ncbi:MAG: heterodisulfide reductase-related iron-sulfur binding cluster [Candidatus Methanomethylicia archaeon]
MTRINDVPNSEEPLYYYPGCLSLNMYPGIAYSTLKVLEMLGYKVFLGEEICCSLTFKNVGLMPPETVYSINAFIMSKTYLKSRFIVTSCNGCYSNLNDTLKKLEDEGFRRLIDELNMTIPQGIKIIHVAEVIYKQIEEIARIGERNLKGLRVAVHYGCDYTYAHPDLVIDSVEYPRFLDDFIERFGGEPIEYDEKQTCCGQPAIKGVGDITMELAKRKILSINSVDTDILLVMCPACLLAFDRVQYSLISLGEINRVIPVIHVSQLAGLILGLNFKDLGLDLHLVKEFNRFHGLR